MERVAESGGTNQGSRVTGLVVGLNKTVDFEKDRSYSAQLR